MIQAVIFDLWETIAKKNIGVSKTLREHFSMPDMDDYTWQYEQAIQLEPWKTVEDMSRSFLQAFDIKITSAAINFVSATMLQGMHRAALIDGMLSLLTKLHTKTKLGLISNTTNFESVVVRQLGITDIFDATLFSWEIGSLKPSQRNFQEIVTRLRVSPASALFIDDSAKNVAAAKAFGLHAIQFHTVESLVDELSNYGFKLW